MIEFQRGYFVDRNGIIYSNKAKNSSIRTIKGKIAKSGYREVLLTVNGKRKYMHVHRIVAETYIKNNGKKRTVNHKNGNKTDNRVSNLEWATDRENLVHARDSGLLNTCKIDMDIAEKIRADTGSHSILAKKYGLGKTQIGYIKNNKRWTK